MNTPASAPAASWWPLTRKMRVVVAAILAADTAQLIAWINGDVTARAALIVAILATAGALGGYLTSETP